MSRLPIAVTAAVLAGCVASVASATSATVAAEVYARAERFLPWNLSRYVTNADIQHHWILGQDRFWYLRSGSDGKRAFILVDARTGGSSEAFDQKLVAAALTTATGKTVEADELPFTMFRYTASNDAIEFQLDQERWTCRIVTSSCVRLPASGPGEFASPGGQWIAYLKGYDLWVRPSGGTAGFALSTDGEAYYAYAASPGDSLDAVGEMRRHEPARPDIVWSPDSRFILTHRIDERQVKPLYLLQSTPDDGSYRPRLFSYRYSLPGDEHVPMLEPVVFDLQTHRQINLTGPPIAGAFISLITNRYTWWSPDSGKVYYIGRDRYSKWVTLYVADPINGQVHPLIHETSDTWVRVGDGGIQNNPAVHALKSGDVIWYSERDGYGHLYYYGGKTGRLRNQITHGPWMVRGIIRADEVARRLYFTASGREPGRDPYERRLYRVNFDGTGTTLLTPEEADHEIHFHEGFMDPPIDPLSTELEENGFSSSGRFFIDIYSRPDAPPIMVLRNASGKLLRTIETANISRLVAGGYTPIEPFQVTAADGKTPLYGNILRPSHFDPNQSYRIIDSIYPGPQMSRTEKTFTSATFNDPFSAQALAELGFVVITVDGRGTPHRSKAFMDESYGQLGNAGNLDDHIAAIRQLAQRYPNLQIDRVGIWGASGGGYAATHGLLQYPDFYKVGVSADGNHDQLGYVSYWGETYNGRVGAADYAAASNEPLASQLTGKLLLIHGEMDDNVHPFLTLRLVNSLINANKDFELAIIPNAGHRVYRSPYAIRRTWDFFVRNLMDASPPANFEIKIAAKHGLSQN